MSERGDVFHRFGGSLPSMNEEYSCRDYSQRDERDNSRWCSQYWSSYDRNIYIHTPNTYSSYVWPFPATTCSFFPWYLTFGRNFNSVKLNLPICSQATFCRSELHARSSYCARSLSCFCYLYSGGGAAKTSWTVAILARISTATRESPRWAARPGRWFINESGKQAGCETSAERCKKEEWKNHC